MPASLVRRSATCECGGATGAPGTDTLPFIADTNKLTGSREVEKLAGFDRFRGESESARSSSTRSLGAALPLCAAVAPIAHGGEPGRVAVEQRGKRKQQRPQRRQAIEAKGRQKGQRHRQPGGEREQLCSGLVCDEQRSGRDVGEEKSGQRSEKQQGRIAKLRERSARDHVADFREGLVGAEAAAGAGQAHPE